VAVVRVAVVLGGNCAGWQLFWVEIVIGISCPGGSCLGGFCFRTEIMIQLFWKYTHALYEHNVYEENHAFFNICCFCNAFDITHNADFTLQ